MIEICDKGFSADYLHRRYSAQAAHFADDWALVRKIMPLQRHEMLPYQSAALYVLAAQFSRPGGRILEIGTFNGASAALMSRAAIMCIITTLESDPLRVETCRVNLRAFPNVRVVAAKSWDFIEAHAAKGKYNFDMIFVDGDHKRVRRDLPWWNWLHTGGLMLFHDYTASESYKVCNAVDALGGILGRAPDVLIIDDQGIGMAGYYKRAGDPAWS